MTPWIEPARAIMTTDTFPKVATRTLKIDGVPVTLNGIAKGAGMIAPDMATMLSFIFTDAPIASEALQTLLSRATKTSFNAITVDSDTSTSDTLLIFATGAAAKRGCPTITAIWFGPHRVAVNGARDQGYDEATVSAYMKSQEIDIRIELGLGKGKFTVYTCDLTKNYVEINGDYRS